MKAKDILPNRYDFAKETLSSFLKSNPKDNIMLIAFTTNPLLLSPLTTDHALIEIALKSLNPEYILTKGTSLKKLFKKIASMQHEQKNLLLITDGGEEHDLTALTEQLKEENIKLTVLALGSTQGTTIEKPNGTLLKDKEGNLVISRINPLLKKLVSNTGGTYLNASNTPTTTAKHLQNAFEKQAQKNNLITKKQYRYNEFYQFPLLLALLLFLMLHTRAIKYLIILFSLLGMQVQASMLDGYYLDQAYESYYKKDLNKTKELLLQLETSSLQSQFALANTYYRLHDYKKAILLYRTIRSTSPKVKQKLYYNLANSYTKLKEYDKAKLYYTKALQLGEESDALHNLALIALLQKSKETQLGITHPKSQSSASSTNDDTQSKEEQSKEESQTSSGSGAGGESKAGNKKEKKKRILDRQQESQPLSSKVYELINKGYIRETQPW
jgi:Ca-activated chloride channel family protein